MKNSTLFIFVIFLASIFIFTNCSNDDDIVLEENTTIFRSEWIAADFEVLFSNLITLFLAEDLPSSFVDDVILVYGKFDFGDNETIVLLPFTSFGGSQHFRLNILSNTQTPNLIDLEILGYSLDGSAINNNFSAFRYVIISDENLDLLDLDFNDYEAVKGRLNLNN